MKVDESTVSEAGFVYATATIAIPKPIIELTPNPDTWSSDYFAFGSKVELTTKDRKETWAEDMFTNKYNMSFNGVTKSASGSELNFEGDSSYAELGK